MKLSKLLKSVNSLTDYITVTHDIVNKYGNTGIQFNMSTVQHLNKIRSLEIEYYHKYEENGAAFLIFERMLCLPASKTWSLFGKEFVSILQYWLDALRKHIINYNVHWWAFLKSLLKFIKELKLKDPSLNNILVEQTGKCLLDLITSNRMNIAQRHEIVHCFNQICENSSKEIRMTLREEFSSYFRRISLIISTCGHLPTQFSMMETLLRWLLRRRDPFVRQQIVASWFPSTLYGESAVKIFLERPWCNFPQDARDFLNAHNEVNNLVTSVLYKRLAVGNTGVLSGAERRGNWLDVNSTDRSISILLEPIQLETLGLLKWNTSEALVVTADKTHTAALHRDATEVILTVTTVSPLCFLPSSITVPDDIVTITVFSEDLKRLDIALRGAFADKYQVLFDINNKMSLSPEQIGRKTFPEKSRRFSHPSERQPQERSAYIVKSGNPVAVRSPSTVSTGSSIAQLREKLMVLPKFKYDKKPVSICAQPQLFTLTEVTEPESHISSTLKSRHYGVCYNKIKRCSTNKLNNDDEYLNNANNRDISPVNEDNSVSCLLVATIGSADESIINDTVERLPKDKQLSVVDLLMQEALQAKIANKEFADNGLVVENTSNIDIKTSNAPKTCTVISNSTTEDSNTVIETPINYVTTRRKNFRTEERVTGKLNPKQNIQNTTDFDVQQTFDVEVIEDFFSQHLSEKKAADLAISPTLARKMNETSSERSDEFDHILDDEDKIEHDPITKEYVVDKIAIVECLNSMVNKICNDFEKCAQYLNIEDTQIGLLDVSKEKGVAQENIRPQKVTALKELEIKEPALPEKEMPQCAKSKVIIHKVSKMTRNVKPRKVTNKRKGKLKLQPVTLSKQIVEDQNAVEFNINNAKDKITPKLDKEEGLDKKTKDNQPMLRRKRKLYSPKDVHTDVERPQAYISETDNDDVTLATLKTYSNTQKTKATTESKAICYKDIERQRRKCIRKPTKRISHNEQMSPRTKLNNDIFNKLREEKNNEEEVTLVKMKYSDNDLAVYNFTSDSEDEDFKKKEISKRISTTTVASIESIISKHGRVINRINYTENKNSSSDENNKKKKHPQRKRNKRTISRKKRNINIEPLHDLIDERMREAPREELNISLICEARQIQSKVREEPEPIIRIPPVLEVIDLENTSKSVKIQNKKPKRKNKRTNKTLSLKKETGATKKVGENGSNDGDITESPLPGLIVENIAAYKENPNDSVLSLMKKMKKVFEGGPTDVNENDTTQNVLSNDEIINYRPMKYTIPALEEINKDDLQMHESLIRSGTSPDIFRKKADKSSNTNENDLNKNETLVESIDSTNISQKETKTNLPRIIENEQMNETSIEINKNSNIPKIKRKSNTSVTSGSISGVNKTDIETIKSSSTSQKNANIKLSGHSNADTEKSIQTIGKSPINAHGDFNEPAPNNKLLKQSIEPRDLELSDLDSSTREYAIELRKETYKESRKSKLPKVLLSRLSPEEIREWSSFTSIESSVSKNYHDKDYSKSETVKSIKVNMKPIGTQETSREARKSKISPIKLFHEVPNNRRNSVSSESDENYSQQIRHLIANKNINSNVRSLRAINEVLKKNSINVSLEKTSETSQKTLESKISTSTRLEESRIDRKRSLSPEPMAIKRRKQKKVNNDLGIVTISESSPNSNVMGWIQRNVSTNNKGDLHHSCIDLVQNVMEKLDTTIEEIQDNTTKSFTNMFVTIKDELSKLNEQRRKMYKKTASEMLHQMVAVVDTKFSELEKWSLQKDRQVMEHFKSLSCELIRKDYMKKRATVAILREDMAVLMENMKKPKRDTV